MDKNKPNTILIVSSELDVSEVVSRIRSIYPIAAWTFIYLLEDLLGQAGEELNRDGHFVIRDFAVHTEVEKVFGQIATKYSVTAVIPNDEFAVYIAAWANDCWQLPGLTFDVATRFRDKKRMKHIAQTFNIPTAKELSLDDITHGAVTFPVILKPRSLAGAVGVRIITEVQQLSEAYATESDDYQDMNEHQYLIETYNSQPLYQIDAVVLKGQLAFLCAGEYLGKPIDYLAECPLGYFSLADDDLHTLWRPFIERVLFAFEGADGVYHIEAFGDAGDGFELLEIAYRPGGASTVDMIKIAYGIDLRFIHLAVQLGLVDALHVDRKGEAFGYMTFPKKHLAKEMLYVTRVSLPSMETLQTLKMKKIAQVGDIASGEFFCHKDCLGAFVFCGDRGSVAHDLKYVEEHYQVHAEAARG
ncbi:serine kinase [Pseudomonas amygdali]|uniref:ATP-grasp domain-containing protein n=1 Tax=Pseudomonas amygdali TaxID=47877 RepID=UPI0018E654E6|nr:serine kinase [Pseudomonas amygdali]MBI6732396.1 serine kinase [Pseudomonas amygdali]MBI6814513.1 serine kinase [Pseudomonas amygdali]